MTKLDIIKESSEMTGLTKVETELVLDSVINSIKSSLANGNRVDIRGFGSFFVKVRKAREARNPSTNERIFLDEKYIPTFKVSKLLKKFVDEEMKDK
tara:strand:+ start:10313 stop:10603 length:291 start_codon:yes stop_codon:yes gene_type:complete